MKNGRNLIFSAWFYKRWVHQAKYASYWGLSGNLKPWNQPWSCGFQSRVVSSTAQHPQLWLQPCKRWCNIIPLSKCTLGIFLPCLKVISNTREMTKVDIILATDSRTHCNTNQSQSCSLIFKHSGIYNVSTWALQLNINTPRPRLQAITWLASEREDLLVTILTSDTTPVSHSCPLDTTHNHIYMTF